MNALEWEFLNVSKVHDSQGKRVVLMVNRGLKTHRVDSVALEEDAAIRLLAQLARAVAQLRGVS